MTTARERPPEEAAIDTSFARGLRLLLVIADRGEVRADELSTALEMPVSTVYRFLRTLGEFGFVDRQGGRFRLGPRLVIGSGPIVTTERLVRAADPVLQELSQVTGETAVVLRRVALDAFLVHQVESQQALRVTLDPETRVPLWSGLFGRILLAWAPDDIVAGSLLAEEHPVDEAARRTDLDALRRARGGVGRDELVDGSVAVAAPILAPDGIIGAVGVLAPAFRCDGECVERARMELPGAARAVVDRLAAEAGGWRTRHHAGRDRRGGPEPTHPPRASRLRA
jgi:IclR family acetate operon transcriptional repressor